MDTCPEWAGEPIQSSRVRDDEGGRYETPIKAVKRIFPDAGRIAETAEKWPESVLFETLPKPANGAWLGGVSANVVRSQR